MPESQTLVAQLVRGGLKEQDSAARILASATTGYVCALGDNPDGSLGAAPLSHRRTAASRHGASVLVVGLDATRQMGPICPILLLENSNLDFESKL